MAEQLGVWLDDARVGTLTATRRSATFQYDDTTVNAAAGLPLLSTALPVQAKPFAAEETLSWFAGLLPENQQREEIQRRFNLQGASWFEMLREIGWECAGAVVVANDDQKPHPGSLKPLTGADLAVRLAALPRHPYDDDSALRISLGGYQSKMLVTRTETGWALPLGGAISTHILKPQPSDRYLGIIEAEAWAMTVARNVTATADVDVLRLDGAPPTLVVTRFDRQGVGVSTIRTHQEDGAQSLGVPPEKKYASSGSANRTDPTLLGLARVLERYSENPRQELLSLLRQVVVNVSVGNTDAHAKNYGVLHPSPQTVSLSPMYDVVPAQVITPATLEMGLRIAGRIRIDRITGAKILEEAETWGIRSRSGVGVVARALEDVETGIELANERFPDADPVVARFVKARVTHLKSTLLDRS